jgi:hypothetical protein
VLRRQLSFANVMSVMAVFIALGGSAWALSKNSVGSRQLKPSAVHTADIAGSAVTSPKVADNSLLGKDFRAGELPPGPISFSKTFPADDKTHLLARVHGIEADGFCSGLLDDVRVTLTPQTAPGPLYISGNKAVDGVLTHLDQTAPGIAVIGGANADLDAIAQVDGTWTHFDLGSYFGGSAGCNFWGLITPPS